MSNRTSSIKTIRTIKALRGDFLTIDLGQTYEGALKAWMKKSPNDTSYRSFEIEDNRKIKLSKEKTSDYYDTSNNLIESIEGKWYFDVEFTKTGEDPLLDAVTIFKGIIYFSNDITGSIGVEVTEPATGGVNGADGNGILSTVDNGNGTFTLNYTDGTSFTTSDLTGPQGADGIVDLTLLTKETSDTGVTVNLAYIGGHTTNVTIPNTVTSYSNIINPVLNGNQTTVINAVQEPTVSSSLNIELNGSSGSMNLNIGGYTYVVNFAGSLSNTVTTFIITQGAIVNVDTGLTVTGSGKSLILTGPFSGEVSVANVSGDLQGNITGAQSKKVFGADFEENTNMKMCFEYNGKFVEYYFVKYEVS
tara:strand:+ start:4167 stop:5249 length:1083 start_codon:yes stop_codon:yes gene_type:complete